MNGNVLYMYMYEGQFTYLDLQMIFFLLLILISRVT